MTLPKFIITMDGVFRLGMVNQHKDLLKPGDQCIGGGYYHFDFVSNRMDGKIVSRYSFSIFLRTFAANFNEILGIA